MSLLYVYIIFNGFRKRLLIINGHNNKLKTKKILFANYTIALVILSFSNMDLKTADVTCPWAT